jgi:hypothetical protein
MIESTCGESMLTCPSARRMKINKLMIEMRITINLR